MDKKDQTERKTQIPHSSFMDLVRNQSLNSFSSSSSSGFSWFDDISSSSPPLDVTNTVYEQGLSESFARINIRGENPDGFWFQRFGSEFVGVHQPNGSYSDTSSYRNQVNECNLLLDQQREQEIKSYETRVQLYNNHVYSMGNALNSTDFMNPARVHDTENARINDLMVKRHGRTGSIWENGEERLIMGQKSSYCNGDVMKRSRNENGGKNLHCHDVSSEGIKGNVYSIAKDRNGGRILQQLFDKGRREDVAIIFNEILDHVVELMTNPSGNYLVQKLFEVCNEEQMTLIARIVTVLPGELINTCLHSYGTRSVQKLIESLKTRHQIDLVSSALAPGILTLMKDQHGNHVIQSCLRNFTNEQNKYIFYIATRFCVDIGTHRHGYCVLQRCIIQSTGIYRDKLATAISHRAYDLALDPYGNFIIQDVIEMNIPASIAIVMAELRGNFLLLSMQKCSSHVVEKCLKVVKHSRLIIIGELMAVSPFDQLVQDPYCNYVIQAALEVTEEGCLRDALREAIKAQPVLRSSPYSKGVISRIQRK